MSTSKIEVGLKVFDRVVVAEEEAIGGGKAGQVHRILNGQAIVEFDDASINPHWVDLTKIKKEGTNDTVRPVDAPKPAKPA